MTIEFENKTYDDKKQALCEFAFCHFPVTVKIDGEELRFDWFSDLEKYILTHWNDSLIIEKAPIKSKMRHYRGVFILSLQKQTNYNFN